MAAAALDPSPRSNLKSLRGSLTALPARCLTTTLSVSPHPPNHPWTDQRSPYSTARAFSSYDSLKLCCTWTITWHQVHQVTGYRLGARVSSAPTILIIESISCLQNALTLNHYRANSLLWNLYLNNLCRDNLTALQTTERSGNPNHHHRKGALHSSLIWNKQVFSTLAVKWASDQSQKTFLKWEPRNENVPAFRSQETAVKVERTASANAQGQEGAQCTQTVDRTMWEITSKEQARQEVRKVDRSQMCRIKTCELHSIYNGKQFCFWLLWETTWSDFYF